MTGGARIDEGSARGSHTTVFVSDPSAEADAVAKELRAAGYVVVDVPLSMLVARVAVQHPRVVLIDADGEGALDAAARMRELPAADGIDVLFVARPGGAVATPEQAMALEGSGLFVRPLDVASVIRKVDALTGGAHAGASSPSAPPPSIPASSRRRSSAPPPSLPPAGARSPSGGPLEPAPTPSARAGGLSRAPSEPPTSGAAAAARRLVGLASPISPELQRLLSDAEQRAQSGNDEPAPLPSPEEEIEAVLPAEYLAALDEPMDEDEEDDDVLPSRVLSGTREPTHDGAIAGSSTGSSTTGGGSLGGTPKSAVEASAARPAADVPLTPSPPPTHGGAGTHSGETGGGTSTPERAVTRDRDPAPAAAIAPERPASLPPPTAWSGRAPHDREPTAAPLPSVLGPGESMRVVAKSILARTTASLCFSGQDVERRVILREGDIVTAASSTEDESLLGFLGARGDLPRETVRRLAGKVPASGRLASAALVARGYLRQDQMWPTLRAHAEWTFARALQMPDARLDVEATPPARLAGEPSVFGAATGASVFVETVRRIVPPADAVARLGGPSARVSDGPHARLLGECALGAAELEPLRRASGRPLREALAAAPGGDLATVILALAELGVLEVLPGIEGDVAPPGSRSAEDAAIDADALRERVRARLSLVEDGDYFAVLGVPREATGYEVRRAFLELRRAFEPSRVLTPDVADLAGDVRKIALVLEEAYDILKDEARRERYRRAIDASPEA